MYLSSLALAARAADIRLNTDSASAIRQGGNHKLSAFYQGYVFTVAVNMVGSCTSFVSALALTILSTSLSLFLASKAASLSTDNPWKGRIVKVLRGIDQAVALAPSVMMVAFLATGAWIPAVAIATSEGIYLVSTYSKSPVALRNVARKVSMVIAGLLSLIGTGVNSISGVFWMTSLVGNWYQERQVSILLQKRKEAAERSGMSWEEIGNYYR